MYNSKVSFYNKIDEVSINISKLLIDKKLVSKEILLNIIDIYKSAKIEKNYENENFLTAYHSPITGDFEFFISRILYNYSLLLNLNWKIYLRKQKGKTVPDIRIEKNDKTIAIIEIKAKAGWIQPVFSIDRFNKDLSNFENGISNYNPQNSINDFRSQINKYAETYEIDKSKIYILLPTLKLVHRENYRKEIEDYENYFEKTSDLSKDNFILLSNNKDLDLSNPKNNELLASNKFENMILKLSE